MIQRVRVSVAIDDSRYESGNVREMEKLKKMLAIFPYIIKLDLSNKTLVASNLRSLRLLTELYALSLSCSYNEDWMKVITDISPRTFSIIRLH